jgi:hypothetical protein
MKKVGFSCCVVLLLLLAGVRSQAVELLAPYDNFKEKQIDLAKWFGGEPAAVVPRSSTKLSSGGVPKPSGKSRAIACT